MSSNLYVVGGRLQVTDSNSYNPLTTVSQWGAQGPNEATVLIGYGRSQQYGDQSAYYLNIFLDTQPGAQTVGGGRILVTSKKDVMPAVETFRWGSASATEVTVFQAFGWSQQYGDSVVYVNYYLGDGASGPVVGGRWQATSPDSKQPWVELSSWGEQTAYEVYVANCIGWSEQYGESYMYQSYFVPDMASMGLQGVVSYRVAVPFPSFDTGTQPQAFASINQQLAALNILTPPAVPDTRVLIAVQAAGTSYPTDLLSDAYGKLGELTRPDDVTPDDWEAVITQLGLELVAAMRVIPFYANNDALLTQVFVTNLGDILEAAKVINAAGSDTFTYNLMNIFAGAAGIAAAASAVAEAAVVAATIGTVVAEVEANGGLPTVDAEVAELLGRLTDGYTAGIAQNHTVLNTIVADWGKLSAVNAIFGQNPWPDTTAQEAALTQAYTITIWQSLLPIKFWVFSPGLYNPAPGGPCEWDQNGGTAMWLGLSSFIEQGVPVPAVCETLFGTGTNQLGVPHQDVFYSFNGWKLKHYQFPSH